VVFLRRRLGLSIGGGCDRGDGVVHATDVVASTGGSGDVGTDNAMGRDVGGTTSGETSTPCVNSDVSTGKGDGGGVGGTTSGVNTSVSMSRTICSMARSNSN
jgi:hypothetical protein